MKRTTYIVLGVIFALIFAHVMGFILLIRMDSEMKKLTFDERSQKEFENVKVVYLEREGGEYNFSGKINVSPVVKEGICKFDYPEKLTDHIHFENSEDTLYIRMDLSDYFASIEELSNRLGSLYIEEIIFDLQLDSVVTYLSSESSNDKWNISHISFDSLQIKTEKELELFSCTIDKFTFSGNGVKANQVMIKEMHLDLDERRVFEMQGGEVDRLFCTGNRKSTIKNSGVIRQLAWTPKEKDATLNIELKAKSEMFFGNK